MSEKRKLSEEDIRQIRETLCGLEVKVSIKELRKLYDSNPRFQFESFEDFVERCRKIKAIIDEMKYQFRVRE